MVIFIPLFQTSQNRDRAHFVGFVDHDDLEPTFESFVLFKIFLIFVERGSADRPQFSSCQSRFQNIGSIHCSVAFTGSHQRVYLVDKKDNFSLALNDFVDYRFQPFFKFSFVFGSGNQSSHVERKDLFAFQVFGNVSAYDTMRQSFGYGCFTRTRFTYQDRIIFGSATQNL